MKLATIDQGLNFIMSIVTMQVSKMPYFQQSNVLWTLRYVYIASIIFQVMFYLIIRKRILSVNDQRKLKIKKENSLFDANRDVEEEIEVTFSEYDLKELNKTMKSAILQSIIVSVLHIKWKIVQPLIVAGTVPLRAFCLNPLYLRYVFNKDVLRPFELNTIFEKEEKVAEKRRKKEE